ncbi:MAG: hypothetical protein GX180_09590 [Enterococcus sp.]|nr:hypothetical protein [Enterococcus sp.]
MARIKGNIFGKITGKIGNLVFQMRGGEQIVKEYAESKNAEATEAQEVVRLKLATASRWAKQAGYYMQNMYNRTGTKKSSNFAELVKAAYYAVDNNFKIDFNKLKLNQINQNDNLIIDAYYDVWTEYLKLNIQVKDGTLATDFKNYFLTGFCGYDENGNLLNEENNLKYAENGIGGIWHTCTRYDGYQDAMCSGTQVLTRRDCVNYSVHGKIIIAIGYADYFCDEDNGRGRWLQYSTGGTYNTRYAIKDYGELVGETTLIELNATENTTEDDIEIIFEEKGGKLESIRIYKKLYGENGQTMEYEVEYINGKEEENHKNYKYTIDKRDIGEGLYIFLIAGYNESDERVTDYYRCLILGKEVIINYKEEEDYLLEHNHITPSGLTIERDKKLLDYDALVLKGNGEEKEGEFKNKVYCLKKEAYTTGIFKEEFLIELKHYKDNKWISRDLEAGANYFIIEVKEKEEDNGKKTGEVVEFTSKDKNNNITKLAPKGYKENENSKKYDIASEITMMKNNSLEIIKKDILKKFLRLKYDEIKFNIAEGELKNIIFTNNIIRKRLLDIKIDEDKDIKVYCI